MRNVRWLFLALLFGLTSSTVLAQDPEPTGILYQDDFSDTASDPDGFFDIGWIRFGPAQNLTNSIVEQRDDALYLQMGSFFGLLGAVVAQTNGLPKYIFGDPDTKADLIANNFSEPNQVFRFRIKFVRMTSSNFLLTTRQKQDTVNPDTTDFIVSNITNKAAYALQLDPLKNKVLMAKFPSDSLSILDVGGPSWTVFGSTDFDFNLNSWYWAKFYLYETTLKAKVWGGNLEDEPAGWLLEAQDDSVWTRGRYSTFVMSGLPPFPADNGDVVLIDDVVGEGFRDVTAVDEAAGAPTDFVLEQNYPNPFNPSTVLRYALPQAGQVSLRIYDVRGAEVLTLVDGMQSAGRQSAMWHGVDASGRVVPAGLYFARLEAAGFSQVRKMILIK